MERAVLANNLAHSESVRMCCTIQEQLVQQTCRLYALQREWGTHWVLSLGELRLADAHEGSPVGLQKVVPRVAACTHKAALLPSQDCHDVR